jgi:hypothetical protein
MAPCADDLIRRRGVGGAARPAAERHELKDVGYEIFVGAVSVLSIVNLLLTYVLEDEVLDTVLLVMNILLTLLLLGILVLEFGSLWMLALEQAAPGANITNASDAIWYVVVTISTVGYGDQYPGDHGRPHPRRRSHRRRRRDLRNLHRLPRQPVPGAPAPGGGGGGGRDP